MKSKLTNNTTLIRIRNAEQPASTGNNSTSTNLDNEFIKSSPTMLSRKTNALLSSVITNEANALTAQKDTINNFISKFSG